MNILLILSNSLIHQRYIILRIHIHKSSGVLLSHIHNELLKVFGACNSELNFREFIVEFVLEIIQLGMFGEEDCVFGFFVSRGIYSE